MIFVRRDATISETIERLEREIAERQQMLTMLRALCADNTKGRMGRPRIYTGEQAAEVGRFIADGMTHRQIAAKLGIPVASVGKMAARVGAKRAVGDKRGGSRKRGAGR